MTHSEVRAPSHASSPGLDAHRQAVGVNHEHEIGEDLLRQQGGLARGRVGGGLADLVDGKLVVRSHVDVVEAEAAGQQVLRRKNGVLYEGFGIDARDGKLQEIRNIVEILGFDSVSSIPMIITALL